MPQPAPSPPSHLLLAQCDKPQGVWGTGPPVQKTLPLVHSQLANSSTPKLNVALNQNTHQTSLKLGIPCKLWVLIAYSRRIWISVLYEKTEEYEQHQMRIETILNHLEYHKGCVYKASKSRQS